MSEFPPSLQSSFPSSFHSPSLLLLLFLFSASILPWSSGRLKRAHNSQWPHFLLTEHSILWLWEDLAIQAKLNPRGTEHCGSPSAARPRGPATSLLPCELGLVIYILRASLSSPANGEQIHSRKHCCGRRITWHGSKPAHRECSKTTDDDDSDRKVL